MTLQCQTSQPRTWVQIPTCLDSQATDRSKQGSGRGLALCLGRGSDSTVSKPALWSLAPPTQPHGKLLKEGLGSSASAAPGSLIKYIDLAPVLAFSPSKQLGLLEFPYPTGAQVSVVCAKVREQLFQNPLWVVADGTEVGKSCSLSCHHGHWCHHQRGHHDRTRRERADQERLPWCALVTHSLICHGNRAR